MYNELGQEVCECATPPSDCPDLDTCSRQCNHGYKSSKKGCPKCRCHKCESFSCHKKCRHGYQTDRNGCHVCKCQGTVFIVFLFIYWLFLNVTDLPPVQPIRSYHLYTLTISTWDSVWSLFGQVVCLQVLWLFPHNMTTEMSESAPARETLNKLLWLYFNECE